MQPSSLLAIRRLLRTVGNLKIETYASLTGETTHYRWTSNYAGVSVDELNWVRELALIMALPKRIHTFVQQINKCFCVKCWTTIFHCHLDDSNGRR